MEPDDLSFDRSGLSYVSAADNGWVWSSEVGDRIEVLFLDELKGPEPEDADALRSWAWNTAAESGLGFVESSPIVLGGHPAARFVFKSRQSPADGFVYMGNVWVPLADFGILFRVEAREGPLTGMREALVIHSRLATGELIVQDDVQPPEGTRRVSGPDSFVGWTIDPMDQRIEPALQPNVSELSEYDERFPDHPLSRTRRALASYQASAEFSAALAAPAPSTPSPSSGNRPWWRFW